MPCANFKVLAVTRALALLDAFRLNEAHVGIAELARRTGLAKTTALRLARTLAAADYLVQLDGGRWRLGPASAWLAARYQGAFDLKGVIQPVLRELATTTGRDALFFAREGDRRVRLMRAEVGMQKSVSPLGERLPLDKGSAGKVILAFLGREGALYDSIRRRGYEVTVGETYPGIGSVSAPVFSSGWSVVGALALSFRPPVPTTRGMTKHAPAVREAARKLSYALMSSPAADLPADHVSAQWHPY